jgi:hypothetical protein
MTRALLRLAAGIACLAGIAMQAGVAQTRPGAPITEQSVKAAYLYKFAGYVEWPDARADSSRPLLIGVLESAGMAEELSRITRGRTIESRPVQVRRMESGEPVAGLDILFVGAAEGEQLAQLLQPAAQLPILTVTDSEGALTDGSIINFTVDRERVRFEVSLPAAERSRLKLSSRLLSVAQRVQRAPES